MNVACRICGVGLEPFHVLPKRALFTKPLREPVPEATGDMHLGYCAGCRHVSCAIDMRMDPAELHRRVYAELYDRYVPTGLSPTQQAWTDFVADWLLAVLPSGARVLEVGSHDGYILHRLAAAGHDCVGVEPSPHADTARDKYGLTVVKDFYKPGQFPDASFDAVVLRHVVEHVEDPATFVADAVRALKPGGLLYVEVPNSYASLDQAFLPEFHVDHLSYFTPPSLVELLRRAGVGNVLHVEGAWAYMMFPFLAALARKGAEPSFRPPAWMQDFRMPTVLERFRARHATYLRNLRALPRDGKLAVWGTGSIGTQYAIDAGWAPDECVYVDIHKANQGLRLSVSGHHVRPPEDLQALEPAAVLIASGWEADVRRQLRPYVPAGTTVLGYSDLIRETST